MREVNTAKHARSMAKEAQSKSQVRIATYHVAKARRGSETADMGALTRAPNSAQAGNCNESEAKLQVERVGNNAKAGNIYIN